MNRRTLLAGAAAIGLSMPLGAAAAAGITTYEPIMFRKAIAAGPVVVHVHAVWCPVCAKQRRSLEQITADPALAKVRFVNVDFDKDKAFLRSNKVTNQSVILVFKGGKEVARLIGTTDETEIRAGVKKVLG